MGIPKKISYCWFGENPKPEKVNKCINSWEKYCPDYEIIEWNESNYDVNKNEFIAAAYKEKKWAFVTDYARLDIIYNVGGIYLDTDVEIIKNIDFLLDNTIFFAIEKERFLIATGLGFGSESHNEILKDLKSDYENISFYKENGDLNQKACTFYTTEYFEKYGFERIDRTQNIRGAIILASDFFCPMDFRDRSLKITDNTVGIHWYDASWFTKEEKHLYDVEVFLKRKAPISIAIILSKIYRCLYRLVEYSRKGILLEKIKRKLKK